MVRKQGASLASWLTKQSSQLSDVAVKTGVATAAAAAIAAAERRTQQDHRPMCIREQSRGFP